ncbi:hypothetical protein SASPL_118161 [Salvia splendens]|uniref:Uncharacterized protein n=1 Tax=Salvia splendens TaxID=180675 RepID=A0A8X8ZZM0_SALSN|nr:hypothetical protein SASPL_118161 [Salvia splendens]
MADSQLRSNAFERNTSFQDSSECGQSKAMKRDRSRRCWSDREEATLIVGLKKLVTVGWKSDNGFREWKEIFGKDRAVGAWSRGAAESAAMMKAVQEQTNGYVDDDYHPSLDELLPDEVVANEVVGEHAIPEPGNSSNTHGERIGYEFEQSAKREEVYKLLGQISGLTMKQKFYTSAKLVKEPELLDLFRSMPEDDRPEFVVFMLESDGMI